MPPLWKELLKKYLSINFGAPKRYGSLEERLPRVENENENENEEGSGSGNEANDDVNINVDIDATAGESKPKRGPFKDIAAFFFIGLINNFSYVIMLSAAEDILESASEIEGFLLPTGVVLLADILPTLLAKSIGPLFMHQISYNKRVVFCVVSGCISFHLVAWFQSSWIALTGVCLASIASGFGEITFLSLSSHYKPTTIAAWSSGTGGAGIAGAGIYALMTIPLGLNHRWTLIIISIAPLILGFFYSFVLGPHGGAGDPLAVAIGVEENEVEDQEEEGLVSHHTHSHSHEIEIIDKLKESNVILGTGKKDKDGKEAAKAVSKLPLRERLLILKSLFKYMGPLFLVYYSEYCINQGVSPVLTFDKGPISARDTYVYYQMIYQIGVFVSRSSVTIVPIRRFLWVPSLLQFFNLVLVLLQVSLGFISSVYVIFGIIFWEGLLGGAVYVNAFTNLSRDIDPAFREWGLGVASVADTCGIALAGLTSVLIEPGLRSIRHPV